MAISISKSNFVDGITCPKRLWLSKYRPEAGAETNAIHTEEGTAVGELARTYFPGAVTVPLDKAAKMTAATQQLLADGAKVVCEATFMADGLSCSADIVLVNADGSLDVVEVKSSTSSTDVQQTDLAFQCHVITSAGYTINRVYLMHINKDYIRGSELDVHQLFCLEAMDFRVAQLTKDVKADILRLQDVLDGTEPTVDIDCYCEKPHECPFKGYCFKALGIPEKSVFAISGLATKKKYELYHQGLITPESLAIHASCISERQGLQVKDMLSGSTDISVNKDAVRRFLSQIRYPLYQLDFESVQHAIPPFAGMKPYEQMPFQYSLHIQTEPDGEPSQHLEFLADAGTDPRRSLAEQLCADIPIGAQSMAYNASFERRIIRALAELFPDLATHLLNIADNMVDLMIPFQKRWVTSPAMNGSYSIKAVLPALCGGDPALDYHNLPVVHNGAEAMETYKALEYISDPKKVADIRKGLLLYCGLDTMAMVKVLQALYALTA